jgi:hypothetical protein
MWSFLKGVELLLIVSFILGFLAKGLSGVFKSLETFLKSAEPSLAGLGESIGESADTKPKPLAEQNQQLTTLIKLLKEGGYLKDGKVDAAAIDRAISPPSS